jgi:hypothetical protein
VLFQQEAQRRQHVPVIINNENAAVGDGGR